MEQLTPRELAITRFVCIGKSDREIAKALYLSLRTVDNSIASACSKLGITTRSGLASVLAASELDSELEPIARARPPVLET